MNHYKTLSRQQAGTMPTWDSLFFFFFSTGKGLWGKVEGIGEQISTKKDKDNKGKDNGEKRKKKRSNYIKAQCDKR